MEIKEDRVTLVKDLYELKGFIENIPDAKFEKYIAKSPDEFYLKVASLVRDQKLIEDITESPSKEAIMLCLNTFINGKPQVQEKNQPKLKISESLTEKMGLITTREFKKAAIIMPLTKMQMITQLKEMYR